ncbi:MAG: 2-oxoglutarate dehydrogenase complex dihydrolipoyllysine-residue succinyltransferase [Candidatus Sericytochromatia bacterium]|nr:2-oxoglutarate dehydrogenase complex dihydrolipoyllysine-residue succinyltransferase [Candidatus Sericytochromatia bacterium]
MSLEIKIPSVGESITEVTISKWLKKNGDFVKLDETICELESDKATFEINSEADGVIHLSVEEGETVNIGTVIGELDIDAKPSNEPIKNEKIDDKKVDDVKAVESKSDSYAKGYPSPTAAKILSEKNISSSEVQGTGKDGRITKQDANLAQKVVNNPIQPIALESQKNNTVSEKTNRDSRREKMSSLRKTISKRLVAVKNETAMLTTFNEVDMKPIMDIRKKYKELFKEKHDVNLGFMSFFAKAVCIALQEFPAVNAQIDGDEIVFNDFCDISIAVSAPKGLVVPVIRSAEMMSFEQIEKDIVRLAVKARENKLSIDEMTGGTFTITNGGTFGSMLSTPIINAPQSAILGMHNIVERPVAINGEVVIRPIMYLALSYDHRIIDGKESVSFLVRVKQLLEDPTRLLLRI